MSNAGWKNLKRTAGPGRPKGRLNNATIEVRRICTALVNDPKYRDNLTRRLQSGKLAPAVECLLWYYSFGKPKDEIEIDDKRPESYRFVFGAVPVPRPAEPDGADE
jgi:hypothetical protein